MGACKAQGPVWRTARRTGREEEDGMSHGAERELWPSGRAIAQFVAALPYPV